MKKSWYPRKIKKRIRKENRALVREFPFLAPQDAWTGKLIDGYNYDYTILDEIPRGWKKRFGEILCEDLKEVLIKNDCFKFDGEGFRILQIKEKYGGIRIYDVGSPSEWDSHMWAWGYISEHTCINCGKFPVPMRDDGWISPECDACIKERVINRNQKYGDGSLNYEEYIENITEEFDGRVNEYLVIRRYNKDGEELKWIDLKPFYDKIGFKYTAENLITKKEIEEKLKEKES